VRKKLLNYFPSFDRHRFRATLSLTFFLFSRTTNSGKTSLLFHYARHVAAATQRPVYFLKSAAAASAGPPLLPAATSATAATATTVAATTTAAEAPAVAKATTATPDPFDLVQMKYVTCIADVVAFAACLHLLAADDDENDDDASRLLPRRPAAVIVDGLSSLPPDDKPSSEASSSFGGGAGDRRATERAVIRALATLSDATAGAWRKSKGEGRNEESLSSPPSPPPIALVVAEESSPDGRAPFYLYRRWLPLVLTCRPAHELAVVGRRGGGGFGNVLSLSPLPPAAGGAALDFNSTTAAPAANAASPAVAAAALYAFEGAGELEAVGVV